MKHQFLFSVAIFDIIALLLLFKCNDFDLIWFDRIQWIMNYELWYIDVGIVCIANWNT